MVYMWIAFPLILTTYKEFSPTHLLLTNVLFSRCLSPSLELRELGLREGKSFPSSSVTEMMSRDARTQTPQRCPPLCTTDVLQGQYGARAVWSRGSGWVFFLGWCLDVTELCSYGWVCLLQTLQTPLPFLDNVCFAFFGPDLVPWKMPPQTTVSLRLSTSMGWFSWSFSSAYQHIYKKIESGSMREMYWQLSVVNLEICCKVWLGL